MIGPVFADTNVFIYQVDSREPEKQLRARAWAEFLWESGRGRISVQVLTELYAALTRKLDPGMDRDTARKMVRALWVWQPLLLDERAFAASWAAQDQFGFSWWDSLIVAAARLAGCSLLLTEDLQHGQDLGGLRVVSPFKLRPEEVEV